ncbi:NUDIX domain-containing protein [Pseudomonadota bacterium]
MGLEFASIMFRSGNYYLLQVRDVKVEGQKKGEYSFVFPGAVGTWGGKVEDGEDHIEAMKREIKEELEFEAPDNYELRQYNWKECLDEVYNEIFEAFDGNLLSFLGYRLDDEIPVSAMGHLRGKIKTYRDYILKHKMDHFFIFDVDKEKFKYKLHEGRRGVWLHYDVVKACVITPADKLVLLHDIVKRVKKGEIEI